MQRTVQIRMYDVDDEEYDHITEYLEITGIKFDVIDSIDR